MTLSLEIDPTDHAALTIVMEALARLVTPRPEASPSLSANENLGEWAFAMVSGYGEGRRRFLRDVAEASIDGSGLEHADCSLTARSLGGTRSSLEKAWRGLGGTGEFIQWTPAKRYRMTPDIAAAVLTALDATEELATSGETPEDRPERPVRKKKVSEAGLALRERMRES